MQALVLISSYITSGYRCNSRRIPTIHSRIAAARDSTSVVVTIGPFPGRTSNTERSTWNENPEHGTQTWGWVYFRPRKSTMSLLVETREMARRLPSCDHAKSAIVRPSVKRVSWRGAEPSSGWIQMFANVALSM